jgi:hypothetical protein
MIRGSETVRDRAAATGAHCPRSGWWLATVGKQPRFIFEGELMPALGGTPAIWRPVSGGAPTIQPMPDDVEASRPATGRYC